MTGSIVIKGARQHNLKNVDVSIPKNQLVVFTGLSGSGKSSLAFDTIYAEGQRRYVESLSSYARQFLGIMSKPDVDSIDGLSPAISIDQKTTSHNPRSTVGTITEIYDYLRLLFARVGHPHCPNCGAEVAKQSSDQITAAVMEQIDLNLTGPQLRLMLLSPVVRDKRGEFQGLFDNLKKKGYTKVRVDGHVIDLDEDILLIKTNKHTIEVVVERVTAEKKALKADDQRALLRSRLNRSIETSLELSGGLVTLSLVRDHSLTFPEKPKDTQNHLYSELFACPNCNISISEIEPRIFSFNSPYGACPTCNGLGTLLKIDAGKIVAPEISLSEGAIIPFARILTGDSWYGRLVKTVISAYGESMKTPFKNLPASLKDILLNGDDPSRVYTVYGTNRFGRDTSIDETFEGFVTNLERRYTQTDSEYIRREIERFMTKTVCPSCRGDRLKPESLAVTIDGRNISEVTSDSIGQTLNWVKSLNASVLSPREREIAALIIKETITRLEFLLSVGLNYLTLNREAGSLAGGEAQRIRLASQIGTGLTGVLYILDEPTIGLHPRDNQRLITTLKHLRDLGNSVIVVEHDADTMRASDQILDFGPGAGKHGGTLVAQGTLQELINNPHSLTGQYLSGKKKVETSNHLAIEPSNPRAIESSNHLTLTGCTLHNLKNLDLTFPLGQLVAVSGVSGSGKSSLIHDTLYWALKQHLGHQIAVGTDHFTGLTTTSPISRVSLIDQSPIGKTPRSNPATYTKIFDLIRAVFAQTAEAHARGYKPGRFSFNVKGGRCEACQGEGQVKIEMQFMPDIYIPCEVCSGSRYNFETLEVLYKGLSISDVLHQTVEEALEFFHNHRGLKDKLQTLFDVGLGYIELGQPAPTLSGGEAQRVKLARELSIHSLGHTIYLLDEPTTGLHFEDTKKLLNVLRSLVIQNNTVIVIEHNLDVIKNVDHIIELGPDGGDTGGFVVATGTPQEIAQNQDSQTGPFLQKLL